MLRTVGLSTCKYHQWDVIHYYFLGSHPPPPFFFAMCLKSSKRDIVFE